MAPGATTDLSAVTFTRAYEEWARREVRAREDDPPRMAARLQLLVHMTAQARVERGEHMGVAEVLRQRDAARADGQLLRREQAHEGPARQRAPAMPRGG